MEISIFIHKIEIILVLGTIIRFMIVLGILSLIYSKELSKFSRCIFTLVNGSSR